MKESMERDTLKASKEQNAKLSEMIKAAESSLKSMQSEMGEELKSLTSRTKGMFEHEVNLTIYMYIIYIYIYSICIYNFLICVYLTL